MLKNRKIALFLAILFCFAIVLSGAATAVEAGHECVGEHCEICHILSSLQGIVKAACISLLLFIAFLFRKKRNAYVSGYKNRFSYGIKLIKLKVELLN